MRKLVTVTEAVKNKQTKLQIVSKLKPNAKDYTERTGKTNCIKACIKDDFICWRVTFTLIFIVFPLKHVYGSMLSPHDDDRSYLNENLRNFSINDYRLLFVNR